VASSTSNRRTLVVDLRGLEFLGVAGARVLFSVARTCARIGAPMYVIVGPEDGVRVVLEGLDETGVLQVLDHPALVPDGHARS
jgi:anti-anti-sigma regulatory factor